MRGTYQMQNPVKLGAVWYANQQLHKVTLTDDAAFSAFSLAC